VGDTKPIYPRMVSASDAQGVQAEFSKDAMPPLISLYIIQDFKSYIYYYHYCWYILKRVMSKLDQQYDQHKQSHNSTWYLPVSFLVETIALAEASPCIPYPPE
jgi:hypothetical protein